MTTATAPLTGDALLSLLASMPDASKSDLVRAAGYIREDGKLNYTAFYEAFLPAKGVPAPKPFTPSPAPAFRTLADLIEIYQLTEVEANWNDIEGLRVSYVCPDFHVIPALDEEELESAVRDELEERGVYNISCGEVEGFNVSLEPQDDGVFAIQGDRDIRTTESFVAV